MFYTYILKSLKDNDLYIGFTDNLKRRFKEHNDGLVESTKERKPFTLVYYEACIIKKRPLKEKSILRQVLEEDILKVEFKHGALAQW